MPTGLWKYHKEGNLKFVYYLDGYPRPHAAPHINFKTFLAALDEPIAKKMLKTARYYDMTLLELALVQVNKYKAAIDAQTRRELIEIIKKMLEKCPDLKIIKTEENDPPLHLAIKSCLDANEAYDFILGDLLVDYSDSDADAGSDADVNTPSLKDATIASLINAIACPENINLKNAKEKTPLLLACKLNEKDCFPPNVLSIVEQLLCVDGIDVNLIGDNHGSALINILSLKTYEENPEKYDSEDENEQDKYRTRAKLLKLLLKRGANLVAPVQLNLNNEQILTTTALHYAASNASYNLFKLALEFITVEMLTLADPQGKKIWNSIFERKNKSSQRDFIYLLLRSLKQEVVKYGAEIIDACINPSLKQFIENHLKMYQLRDQKDIWVKSLDVFYYRRRYKGDVKTDGESTHFLLKAKSTMAKPAAPTTTNLNQQDMTDCNITTAAITFIVQHDSDSTPYTTQYDIDIGDEFYTQIKTLIGQTDYKNHLKAYLNKFYGQKFRINKQETAEKIKPVEQHGNFEGVFNHSEEALFYYLLQDERINFLVKKFKDKIQSLFARGETTIVEVKAAILNLFSKFYMCENCQAMGHAFQEAFVAKLTASLKDNFSVKSSLPFIMVVSVDEPRPHQARWKGAIEKCRFFEADHKDLAIDLKTLSEMDKKYIFFKDSSQTIPQDVFGFFSRFHNKIDRLQQTTNELQDENRALKKINEEQKRQSEIQQRQIGQLILEKFERTTKAEDFDYEMGEEQDNMQQAPSKMLAASSAATVDCDEGEGSVAEQISSSKRRKLK
jgi:antirestriction protein